MSRLLLQGCHKCGRYVARKNGVPVINYISYRDNRGLISFMPMNRKQNFLFDGVLAKEGRQTMKPAKFARTLLNPRLVKRLNDKHFSDFANKFKANELEKEIELNVISVEGAYTHNNCAVTSCMQGKPVHNFYKKFGCKVLVAQKNKQIIGRALLWNNVTINGKPAKFMDRIYSSSEEVTELIKRWAMHNGFYRKNNQNSKKEEPLVSPKGDILYNHVIVAKAVKRQLRHDNIFIPYLDTLEFTDSKHNIVSNKFRVHSKVFCMMKDANGRIDVFDNHVEALNYTGGSTISNKEYCARYKGKYYHRSHDDVYSYGGKFYHKNDKRVFIYNNICYLKSQHVIINGVLYAKNSKDVYKAKNNRWYLAPEIEKIEKAEEFVLKTNKVGDYITSYDFRTIFSQIVQFRAI